MLYKVQRAKPQTGRPHKATLSSSGMLSGVPVCMAGPLGCAVRAEQLVYWLLHVATAQHIAVGQVLDTAEPSHRRGRSRQALQHHVFNQAANKAQCIILLCTACRSPGLTSLRFWVTHVLLKLTSTTRRTLGHSLTHEWWGIAVHSKCDAVKGLHIHRALSYAHATTHQMPG